jgi:hypothetical protein
MDKIFDTCIGILAELGKIKRDFEADLINGIASKKLFFCSGLDI